MKLATLAVVAAVSTPPSSLAFVNRPTTSFLERIVNDNAIARTSRVVAARPTTSLAAIDPNVFHDLQHHIPSIQDALSSLVLSDEAVADVVEEVAKSDNGWFGFLTGPIEFLLQVIHSALVGVGVSANSWGVSIIAMTCVIKLATYPLTKNQMESTTKMQAMQPLVKQLQAKYQSNPEMMNRKISELYQENEVNPLAGCLPAIVQLPVFIGLYRAVLALAKDDKLNESFLWLPNLEGPVYGADPASGADWILKGWNNFEPSLGWPDTVAFLTLPVILIVSQLISQELMTPKNPDGSAPESNAVLKFLPFLIGWFSLSVPAALGIYWVFNNLITTAISLQIRSGIDMPAMSSSGSAVMDAPKTTTTFTPAQIREKPSGFGATAVDPNEIKPITPVVDAEVVAVEVSEDETDEDETETTSEGKSKKKRGKKRKKN